MSCSDSRALIKDKDEGETHKVRNSDPKTRRNSDRRPDTRHRMKAHKDLLFASSTHASTSEEASVLTFCNTPSAPPFPFSLGVIEASVILSANALPRRAQKQRLISISDSSGRAWEKITLHGKLQQIKIFGRSMPYSFRTEPAWASRLAGACLLNCQVLTRF